MNQLQKSEFMSKIFVGKNEKIIFFTQIIWNSMHIWQTVKYTIMHNTYM